MKNLVYNKHFYLKKYLITLIELIFLDDQFSECLHFKIQSYLTLMY